MPGAALRWVVEDGGVPASFAFHCVSGGRRQANCGPCPSAASNPTVTAVQGTEPCDLRSEVEKAGLLPLRPEDGGSAEDGVAGGAQRMSGCRARACTAALRSTLLSHAACDLGSWPMWWSRGVSCSPSCRSQSQETQPH